MDNNYPSSTDPTIPATQSPYYTNQGQRRPYQFPGPAQQPEYRQDPTRRAYPQQPAYGQQGYSQRPPGYPVESPRQDEIPVYQPTQPASAFGLKPGPHGRPPRRP